MKNLLIICSSLFFLGIQNTYAQTAKSTYLYLEVDKNLPVGIKLNNRNIKNERKGYIIIPRMKDGKNTLEFKFANPNFKTHQFEIESSGKRSMGLKLMRVSNNKFVLQNVVNRRIISDVSTIKSAPIAINTKKNTPATAEQETVAANKTPKHGIIKVYEADEAPTKKKKEKTTTSSKSTQVKPITRTTTKPKTYAMYQNRRPMTAAQKRNRYKDYGKAKRAKRRAARAAKEQADRKPSPIKSVDEKKAEVERLKQKEGKKLRKEQQRKEQQLKEKEQYLLQKKIQEEKKAKRLARKEKERMAREKKSKEREILERKKQLSKQKIREEKKLKREARIKAQLAREQAEDERLEKERIELKKQRQAKLAEKRRLARERKEKQEADIRATKKMRLSKKRAKEKAAIEERVINAEPVSDQPVRGRDLDNEVNLSPTHCAHSVRSEKAAEWTLKLHKKFDDEARMNYIRRKMGSRCISSNDLGVLLGNMETQIGRYKMIRSVYDQIEDPSNIDRLFKYFQSKSYINKLKELKPTRY